MGLAQYAIVPVRDQWGVLHDGNINGEYATKESAFESAAAAAALAIRQGHEVHLSVPGREPGEAALGVCRSGFHGADAGRRLRRRRDYHDILSEDDIQRE